MLRVLVAILNCQLPQKLSKNSSNSNATSIIASVGRYRINYDPGKLSAHKLQIGVPMHKITPVFLRPIYCYQIPILREICQEYKYHHNTVISINTPRHRK